MATVAEVQRELVRRELARRQEGVRGGVRPPPRPSPQPAPQAAAAAAVESPSFFQRNVVDPITQRFMGTDIPGGDPLATERAVTVGGMALAGGLVGAKAPVPGVAKLGTMALGSALGTAGGVFAPETTQAVMRALGVDPKKEGLPFSTLAETILPAELMMDLAALGIFTGGQQAVRKVVPAALGVRKEGRRLAKVAGEFGLDLDILRATQSRIVRAIGPTLAIFPFAGVHFRKGAIRVLGQSREAGVNLASSFAPAVNLTTAAQRVLTRSRALVRGAKSTFDKKYSALRKQALDENVAFRVDESVTKGQKLIEALRRSQETVRDPVTGRFKLVPLGASLQSVIGFIEKRVLAARGIPQSFDQFDRIVKDLDALIAKQGKAGNSEAVKNLTDLRKSLVSDFRVNNTGSEAFKEVLANTDAEFHKFMNLMETQTGQILGRTQRRGLTGFGFKPTTTYPVEVFEALFRSGDSLAMRQLEKIIGPRGFRIAFSTHIADMAERATKTLDLAGGEALKYVDPREFARRLGIEIVETGKKIPQIAAVSERLKVAFKLAGLDANTAERLLKAMAQAIPKNLSQFVGESIQFVRRRIILGGRRAIVGLFTAGATTFAAGGVLSGVAVILSVRAFGHLITDPTILKSFKTAVNTIAKRSVRRTAFVDFIQATLELEQDAEIRKSIGDAIRSIGAEVGGVGAEGQQLWNDITAAKPIGKTIYNLGRRAFTGPRQ